MPPDESDRGAGNHGVWHRRGEIAHLFELTKGGRLFYQLCRETFPGISTDLIHLDLQLWCRFHGRRPPLPQRQT